MIYQFQFPLVIILRFLPGGFWFKEDPIYGWGHASYLCISTCFDVPKDSKCLFAALRKIWY
ncbi:unnamed protein product [Schistosoma haematobium]|nr:unnamed protein product [Schistosoma haematobium]